MLFTVGDKMHWTNEKSIFLTTEKHDRKIIPRDVNNTFT